MREREEREEEMFKVGDLVKVCRVKAGLTQTELAQRAFTSQCYLSSVERNKSMPKVDWLEGVLNVCGYELGIREKL